MRLITSLLVVHALLGVAQGSVNPPKLIVATYKGSNGKGKGPRLGFIGKGIAFDSGGISIKPMSGNLWPTKGTIISLAGQMSKDLLGPT